MKINCQVSKILGSYITLHIQDNMPEVRAGMKASLDIKVRERKRTLNQNALFHLWLNHCAVQLFLEPAELKEILKELFLSKFVVVNKEKYKFTRHTSDLSKSEFSEFWIKCETRVIEMGVDDTRFWNEYEQYKLYLEY